MEIVFDIVLNQPKYMDIVFDSLTYEHEQQNIEKKIQEINIKKCTIVLTI